MLGWDTGPTLGARVCSKRGEDQNTNNAGQGCIWETEFMVGWQKLKVPSSSHSPILSLHINTHLRTGREAIALLRWGPIPYTTSSWSTASKILNFNRCPLHTCPLNNSGAQRSIWKTLTCGLQRLRSQTSRHCSAMTTTESDLVFVPWIYDIIQVYSYLGGWDGLTMSSRSDWAT